MQNKQKFLSYGKKKQMSYAFEMEKIYLPCLAERLSDQAIYCCARQTLPLFGNVNNSGFYLTVQQLQRSKSQSRLDLQLERKMALKGIKVIELAGK